MNVLEGKTVALDVEHYYTINNVKTLITMAESVPLNMQKLIFGGKELENERTLKDYNIKNEDMLYMTETVVYNT